MTNTPQTTPTTETQGRHIVKCDECREKTQRTDSARGSAEGGQCIKCQKEAWRIDFERRASWADGMES